MHSLADFFRQQVESFLTTSGMKASEFGRQAVNDPTFVTHLRRGRSCTLALADRVLQFIREQENK